MNKAFMYTPSYWTEFARHHFSLRKLKYYCCLTIATGLVVSRSFGVNAINWWSLPQSSSHGIGICRSCDWWDCPQKLPPYQRVFNKSILYLKPHKTGSETFKHILLRVGEYYNLTTDKELDWKLRQVASKLERRALLRNQYDILLRHSRYRKNRTEQRIRGWDESKLGSRDSLNETSTTQRDLLKIVTIRNPIDRLFSHYFSQRRFRSFIPERGYVRPGKLSEEEEIRDFEEWLQQYKPSQQVFYNRDVSSWSQQNVGGQQLLDGVQEVVDFYDHVIVTDQWKQSLCLFGFTERIHPTLLLLQKRNSNGVHGRRFRATSVIANRALFAKVVAKIEYDFLLYHALLNKYNEKLDIVGNAELGRYCDQVSTEAEAAQAEQ